MNLRAANAAGLFHLPSMLVLDASGFIPLPGAFQQPHHRGDHGRERLAQVDPRDNPSCDQQVDHAVKSLQKIGQQQEEGKAQQRASLLSEDSPLLFQQIKKTQNGRGKTLPRPYIQRTRKRWKRNGTAPKIRN